VQALMSAANDFLQSDWENSAFLISLNKRSTFHIFTLYIPHSTFHIPHISHFSLHIPHCTSHIPHCAPHMFHILQSSIAHFHIPLFFEFWRYNLCLFQLRYFLTACWFVWTFQEAAVFKVKIQNDEEGNKHLSTMEQSSPCPLRWVRC